MGLFKKKWFRTLAKVAVPMAIPFISSGEAIEEKQAAKEENEAAEDRVKDFEQDQRNKEQDAKNLREAKRKSLLSFNATGPLGIRNHNSLSTGRNRLLGS
jgi:hypothetical protein